MIKVHINSSSHNTKYKAFHDQAPTQATLLEVQAFIEKHTLSRTLDLLNSSPTTA